MVITKKELLSKLYDDNTICYWVNLQDVYILNKKDQYIANLELKRVIIEFSYDKIWKDFESKFGVNYQEIRDLTVGILRDHLKQKTLTIMSMWIPKPF